MENNRLIFEQYTELVMNASGQEKLKQINEYLKPSMFHIDNSEMLNALSPVSISNESVSKILFEAAALIEFNHWNQCKLIWTMSDICPMDLTINGKEYSYPRLQSNSLYRLKLPDGQEIITWIDSELPFKIINKDDSLYFREDDHMSRFEPKFTLIQTAHIRSAYVDRLNKAIQDIQPLMAAEQHYVLIEIPSAKKTNAKTTQCSCQVLVLYKDGTAFLLTKNESNTFSPGDKSCLSSLFGKDIDTLSKFFARAVYSINFTN